MDSKTLKNANVEQNLKMDVQKNAEEVKTTVNNPAQPLQEDKAAKDLKKSKKTQNNKKKDKEQTDKLKNYTAKKVPEIVPKKETKKERQEREKAEKERAAKKLGELHNTLDAEEEYGMKGHIEPVRRRKYKSLKKSEKEARAAMAVKRLANAKKLKGFKVPEFKHEEIDEEVLAVKIKEFINLRFRVLSMDNDEDFVRNLSGNYELCNMAKDMKLWIDAAVEGDYLPKDADLETIEAQVAAYGELEKYLDTQKKLMRNPYYQYMAKEDIKYTPHQMRYFANRTKNKDLQQYLTTCANLKELSFTRKKGMSSVSKSAAIEGKRRANILRTRGEKREAIEMLKEGITNFGECERYRNKNYDEKYTTEAFASALENFKKLKPKDLHFSSISDMAAHFAENAYIFEQTRTFQHLLAVAVQRGEVPENDRELIELRAKIRTFTMAEYVTHAIAVRMITNPDKCINEQTFEELISDTCEDVKNKISPDGPDVPGPGMDMKKYFEYVRKVYTEENRDKNKEKSISRIYRLTHPKEENGNLSPGNMPPEELARRKKDFQKNLILNEYIADLADCEEYKTSYRSLIIAHLTAKGAGLDKPEQMDRVFARYLHGMSSDEMKKAIRIHQLGSPEEKQKLYSDIAKEMEAYSFNDLDADTPEAFINNAAYRSKMSAMFSSVAGGSDFQLREFIKDEDLLKRMRLNQAVGHVHGSMMLTLAQANKFKPGLAMTIQDWFSIDHAKVELFNASLEDHDKGLIIGGETFAENEEQSRGLFNILMKSPFMYSPRISSHDKDKQAGGAKYINNATQTLYEEKVAGGMWTETSGKDVEEISRFYKDYFNEDKTKCTEFENGIKAELLKNEMNAEQIGYSRAGFLYDICRMNKYDQKTAVNLFKVLCLHIPAKNQNAAFKKQRAAAIEDCIRTVMSFDLSRFNFKSYKDIIASPKEDPERFAECFAICRISGEINVLLEEYRNLTGTKKRLKEDHLREVDSRVKLIMSAAPLFSGAYKDILGFDGLKGIKDSEGKDMSFDRIMHMTEAQIADRSKGAGDDDTKNFWNKTGEMVTALNGFDIGISLSKIKSSRRFKDGLKGESREAEILNILNKKPGVLKDLVVTDPMLYYQGESAFLKRFSSYFKTEDQSVSQREARMNSPKSRLKVRREVAEDLIKARNETRSQMAKARRNLSIEHHMALDEETLRYLSAFMTGNKAEDDALALKYENQKGTGRFELMDKLTRQLMDTEIHKNMESDRDFGDASDNMERLSSMAIAYDKLLKANPAYADRLKVTSGNANETDYDRVMFKLNKMLAFSDYYRARMLLITDPYYISHTDDELSASHTDKSSEDQKRVAALIRLVAQCTRRMDNPDILSRTESGVEDILAGMEVRSQQAPYLKGQVDLKKATDISYLKKCNDEIRRYYAKVIEKCSENPNKPMSEEEVYTKLQESNGKAPFPGASKYETPAVKNHIEMVRTHKKQNGIYAGLMDILNDDQKKMYTQIDEALGKGKDRMREFSLQKPGSNEKLGLTTLPGRIITSIVVLYGNNMPIEEILEMFDDFDFARKNSLDLNKKENYEYARKRWLSGAKKLFMLEYNAVKRWESTYGRLPEQLPQGAFFLGAGESQGELLHRMMFGQDVSNFVDTADVDAVCTDAEGQKSNLGAVLVKEGLISEAEYSDAFNLNSLYYQTANTGFSTYRRAAPQLFGNEDVPEMSAVQYEEFVKLRHQANNYKIKGPSLSFSELHKTYKDAMENDRKALLAGYSAGLFAENKLGVLTKAQWEEKKKLRQQKSSLIHFHEATADERAEDLTKAILSKMGLEAGSANEELVKKLICFHPAMMTDKAVDEADNEAFIATVKDIAGIDVPKDQLIERKKAAFERLIERMHTVRGVGLMAGTLDGNGMDNNSLVDDSLYDTVRDRKNHVTGKKLKTEIVYESRVMRTAICSKMMTSLQELFVKDQDTGSVTQEMYEEFREDSGRLLCNLILRSIMTSRRYLDMKDVGNRYRTAPEINMERMEYLAAYLSGRPDLNLDKELTPDMIALLKDNGIDILPPGLKFGVRKIAQPEHVEITQPGSIKTTSRKKKTEAKKAENKVSEEKKENLNVILEEKKENLNVIHEEEENLNVIHEDEENLNVIHEEEEEVPAVMAPVFEGLNYDKQGFTQYCWACTLAGLMNAYAGKQITSLKTILNKSNKLKVPSFKNSGYEDQKAYDEAVLLANEMYNGNKTGNPSIIGDYVFKTLPGTAIRSAMIGVDEGKEKAARDIFRQIADEQLKKGPFGILHNGHYVMVRGIQGDKLLVNNSLKGNPSEVVPYDYTISQIFIVRKNDVQFNHIELVWLQDMKGSEQAIADEFQFKYDEKTGEYKVDATKLKDSQGKGADTILHRNGIEGSYVTNDQIASWQIYIPKSLKQGAVSGDNKIIEEEEPVNMIFTAQTEKKTEPKTEQKTNLISQVAPLIIKSASKKKYKTLDVSMKKEIRAYHKKIDDIITQRLDFAQSNEKLQYGKVHDTMASRKAAGAAGILTYLSGDSDEEAWDLHRGLIQSEKKDMKPEEKKDLAYSLERVFEQILKYDINRFKVSKYEDILSEKHLEDTLMSYLVFELQEKVIDKYAELINDPEAGCALNADLLNEVRIKWREIDTAGGFFYSYFQCSKTQSIDKEGFSKAFNMSNDKLDKLTEEAEFNLDKDKSDFYSQVITVKHISKQTGFTPGMDPGKHYTEARKKAGLKTDNTKAAMDAILKKHKEAGREKARRDGTLVPMDSPLITKGPFVLKDYPAIKVKDKALIKASADKYIKIIRQRYDFISDNVNLQSKEWKKTHLDPTSADSRKAKGMTSIMSYFYGDSDEEAWELYSSLMVDKKTADAPLKQKKARSLERIFEHIISFDLNRFNIKDVNDMLSEKYMDEMLMSYMTFEFPPELIDEYGEYIKDSKIDCALNQMELKEVRFRWNFIKDTSEMFRMLQTEAAKPDVTQEDLNLAMKLSSEQCFEMVSKYAKTSRDRANFFSLMSGVKRHFEETGFKPGYNVSRHYWDVRRKNAVPSFGSDINIISDIHKKRQESGQDPADNRMTAVDMYAPTLDEELDRAVKHYNGSGISKAGLQDVIETTRAMYEVNRQKNASIPIDLYRSVDKLGVLQGIDHRGLLSLMRPVKLDASGMPATKEDEINLRQNIIDINKLKENTLSSRVDVLENMVSRAKSIMFTPKELKDYKFLRSNRERAIRCMQMMFSMLNLFEGNKEYFVNQAPEGTRAFMFMLNEGTDYVSYMTFHIQMALFSHGNLIKGMGGSSWQDYRVLYDSGVDYKQMRAENKKIATEMNPASVMYGREYGFRVREGKHDPFFNNVEAECKTEADYEKKAFEIEQRENEIETIKDFAKQGQNMNISAVPSAGERIMLKKQLGKNAKKTSYAEREKIINRYMGGFKKKDYDPRLMREIDGVISDYIADLKARKKDLSNGVPDDITPEMKNRLKEIDELYKGSGIPQNDLDLIKDMELRGMIFEKRVENALPEELMNEIGGNVNKDFIGIDGRGIAYLLQPVGLNEKGEPANEEEQKKREQNVQEVNALKSNKISERKPMLDRIASEAADKIFTTEQLSDPEYILAHRDKALRAYAFMFNGMNLYHDHREYYMTQAPDEARVVMYLLFGATHYADFAMHRIKSALYSCGYGVPPVGGSSVGGSSFVQFKKGDRYKDVKAENDKIAKMNNHQADMYLTHINGYKNDPYNDRDVFRDKAIRNELKAMEKEHANVSTELTSLSPEESFLAKKEFGEDIKNVTIVQRMDIASKYVDEFMAKRRDKNYIKNMVKMIEENVKTVKPGELLDDRLVNDLKK